MLQPWAEPGDGREGERADARRFRAEVRRLEPGGAVDIPHLDEALVHKYLDDLRGLGIIQGPGPEAYLMK